MLPEEDFGKILAKSSLGSVFFPEDYGIDPEGLKLILRALFGDKSIQEASFSQYYC